MEMKMRQKKNMQKTIDPKKNRQNPIRHGRMKAAIAALLIGCLLLSGCGQGAGSAAEESTVSETEAPAPETVPESEAPAATAETEPRETETETATEEETEMADYSWIEPYREFLSDHENLLPLLQEQNEGGMRGFISGFYLHDIDGNGIPELLVQKYITADYIYTCVDGEVQLRNVLPYDSFSDALIARDPADGKLYYFILDAGTGTDRVISLSELSLPDEGEWERNADIGKEYLYGALYGGIEQQDGSYLDLEWEDAIPHEGNAISKEEFQGILSRLEAVIPREITEENLNKYLREDYLESDMYAPCSIEEYKERMEAKNAAFDENAPTVTEGSDGIKENLISVEGWNSAIYRDLDNLVCYREEELEYAYAEEWKNLYRDWMVNIDQQVTQSGYPIVYEDSLEYVSFRLYDWSCLDVPVLGCESSAGNPSYYVYAEDGQVKPFYEDGRLSFIQGTNYYTDSYGMNVGKFVSIYQFENGESRDISGYSAYVDSYSISDQRFTVQGQEATMEEFTAYTDANLGPGAAAQFINMIIGAEGPEPLTYVESVYFTYDEIDEALSSFS
ncbi:MAG TPA: hypothetical protein H9700_13320 [Candidatus Eisenbergiella intestinipullorum]|nr:hypothetical protein [Candidatus Eisenbergiella intestinipullorum]